VTSKMEQETEIKHQKFIPQTVVSFDQMEILNQTMENDVYQKFEATTKVKGELVVCKDPKKMKKYKKRLVNETYEEYLQVLETRDPAKDLWIYNIIDGTAEQDQILYSDEHFILIPSFTFDGKSVDKLHYLAIPRDKSLRTIRDLRAEHCPLLRHMKCLSLNALASHFHLREENLKIFFHYDPSTYHLHMHIVNLEHMFGSSVEYSHEADLVVYNLELSSEYYKNVLLKKRA
jgi:m7GpppX diphosphatase